MNYANPFCINLYVQTNELLFGGNSSVIIEPAILHCDAPVVPFNEGLHIKMKRGEEKEDE